MEEQIGCGPISKANPDPRWWVFSSIGFLFPRDAIKKDCTNIGSYDGSGVGLGNVPSEKNCDRTWLINDGIIKKDHLSWHNV